jgi:hypothetical protein
MCNSLKSNIIVSPCRVAKAWQILLLGSARVLPGPKKGTKNSNTVTGQGCRKRLLNRVRVGRQSHTVKTCHSGLMIKHSTLVSCLSYIHVISMDVVER